MMNPVFGASSDALFSQIASRSAQGGQLAGGALSRGIDAYIGKDYNKAVTEFRRSIGLDPYSSNALKAYDFMAQAYLKLDRPTDAESAYKQAIRFSPGSDDMRLKLANLYFTQKRYDEAEKQYADAVRVNPSEQNIYSLGQLYLSTNSLNDAETQFKKILGMNSNHYGAIYSLGQIDAKRGNYSEAISKFQRTIELNKDFAFAYSDLGRAYADTGDADKAEQQARILDDMDSGLASDLRNYLYTTRKPGISFVTTYTAFSMSSKGPRTLVSSLDSALADPNAPKDFTMTVYFDKVMDRASVENLTNWKIGRSAGPEGGVYNWGLTIPDTEVTLPALPKNIYYDAESMSAKVTFTIKQNATGDGTIDPSHLVFGFFGKDAYGNTMNTSKDQYVGLSIIV